MPALSAGRPEESHTEQPQYGHRPPVHSGFPLDKMSRGFPHTSGEDRWATEGDKSDFLVVELVCLHCMPWVQKKNCLNCFPLFWRKMIYMFNSLMLIIHSVKKLSNTLWKDHTIQCILFSEDTAMFNQYKTLRQTKTAFVSCNPNFSMNHSNTNKSNQTKENQTKEGNKMCWITSSSPSSSVPAATTPPSDTNRVVHLSRALQVNSTVWSFVL